MIANKAEIADLLSKLDKIKDEKIDLLKKVERKNIEIESTKMTMENIEKHNGVYVKKLREFNNEMHSKASRMNDVKVT